MNREVKVAAVRIRRSVFMLAGLMVLLAFGFAVSLRPERLTVPQKMGASPPAVAAMRSGLAPTPGSVRADQSAHSAQADRSTVQAEALRKAQDTMRQNASLLLRNQRFLGNKQTETEAFERLLKDPMVRGEAVGIVSSLVHAEKTYGQDQAAVRVYALRMLRHAARQGEYELIGDTLGRLSQELSSADAPRRGQDEDYVSLVASYIIARGDQAILDDPGEFFETIGLTPSNELEIHKAIYDSGIMRRVPLDKLQAALSPYFASGTKGR